MRSIGYGGGHSHSDSRMEPPPALRAQAGEVRKATYLGSCFGIMPFSFSMSLMFILMPPGITMSPGF